MYEYKRRILLDIYWKLSISFNRIWTKVLIEFGKSASKLNCIILKIVGMKLIFARPILNLSCFETSTSPNLKQEKIWFKKSLVTAPKEERLNYFSFLPTLIFKKTGNSAPLRTAIFCTKVNRFPNCITRPTQGYISHHIGYFLLWTKKKCPIKLRFYEKTHLTAAFLPFSKPKEGMREGR